MNKIKEAFRQVKGDISSLSQDISILRARLKETQEEMVKICNILTYLSKKKDEEPGISNRNKESKEDPADQHINLTDSSYIPAHNPLLEPLKGKNKLFSTGNEGVPTDRQTDQHIHTPPINEFTKVENYNKIDLNSIDEAAKMLESLDNIKKEIRIAFKRLTEQEVLVFSAIYQLDDENGYTDYKSLATKLSLTESSMRDYVGRLLKKGIPLEKKKINNKLIQISVSKNLKKIASLSTILQLRDI